MSLGNYLSESRKRIGMTLDEVARAAGTSKSNLHAIEHGKSEPGFGLAVRLSVALGVPLQGMAAASLIPHVAEPAAAMGGE